jgi:hypothetical protein
MLALLFFNYQLCFQWDHKQKFSINVGWFCAVG